MGKQHEGRMPALSPANDQTAGDEPPDPRLVELVTLLAQSSARRYYAEKMREYLETRP